MEPLERLAFSFLAQYQNERTRNGYRHDLLVFVNWSTERGLKVLEVERAHLDLYITWLQQQQYSESTVSKRIGTVCQFYRYAFEEEFITRDPGRRLKRPQVDHKKQKRTFLMPLHFSYLLSVAEQTSPNDHALVALLGMVGLRIAEACSLDISDLTWQNGYRVITFIGKGGDQYTTVLPVPVMRAVERAVEGRDMGPILLTRRGTRMDRSAASRALKRLGTAAGIGTGFSPHSLRRTYCTTGLAIGESLYSMQLGMRHKDPKTTTRYDMLNASLDRSPSHKIAGYYSTMAN